MPVSLSLNTAPVIKFESVAISSNDSCHRRIPKGEIGDFPEGILQIVRIGQARFYREDDAIRRATTVALLPFSSNSLLTAPGNSCSTKA